MQSYFVSHAGQQMGPWTQDEIMQKLKTHALNWNDYIYEESKEDWIFIMDHVEFAAHYESVRPATPPKSPALTSLSQPPPSEPTPAGEKEWFILKAENRYGPFSYVELVRMLQEKNLYEFDYIWNQSMTAWARVAEVAEFRPEKIRALKDTGAPEVQEVFFRRRHARARYGASIIVHNNKKVWKGQSLELSSGGAGLEIDNADLQPGQTLFLHFKPGDGVPPFNAICTIVSKQSLKRGNQSQYGVKFTSINRTIQAAIKDYTEKAA